MTNNEEAIYVLKNAAFLSSGRDFEEVEEAVRLAISALEEIDRIKAERDAAIKDLSNTTSACNYCVGRCENEVLGSGGCSFEWRGIKHDE